MTEGQFITRECYYVISKDLTYKRISDIKAAKKVNDLKYLLKHSIGLEEFTTHFGKENRIEIAKLALLDIEGQVIEEIKEGDWIFRVKGFGHPYGKFSYSTMWVTFIDAIGNSQTEQFGISLEEFIRAYKRFQKLNRFKEYTHAMLAIQNEELIAHNQSLHEQIDSLTKERDSLKHRLSSIALQCKYESEP